jgi:hypothetical protein
LESNRDSPSSKAQFAYFLRIPAIGVG